MDNFYHGLTFYKSEECPCCEDGIVEIFTRRGISEVISVEKCFCCDGKGFLYLKYKSGDTINEDR